MTANYAAEIAAAQARLVAARAEVEDLRRKLADELAEAKATPAASHAEAGRSEAARRYPNKAATDTRSISLGRRR